MGMKGDAGFGPVVAFGLGGTITEVFRDIVLAIPPLSPGAMSLNSSTSSAARRCWAWARRSAANRPSGPRPEQKLLLRGFWSGQNPGLA